MPDCAASSGRRPRVRRMPAGWLPATPQAGSERVSRQPLSCPAHGGVPGMIKALLLEKDDAGFRAGVQSIDENRLPEGDVLVRVEHSTLNYKDGLAITDKGPVVRSWPMVAGIDGAGTVLRSTH